MLYSHKRTYELLLEFLSDVGIFLFTRRKLFVVFLAVFCGLW